MTLYLEMKNRDHKIQKPEKCSLACILFLSEQGRFLGNTTIG